LQSQSELPAAELELAPHVSQAKADVAAAYLPAAQSAHSSEPGAALNFPAAQAVHSSLCASPLKPALHWHLQKISKISKNAKFTLQRTKVD
jgi:hypothetical protein